MSNPPSSSPHPSPPQERAASALAQIADDLKSMADELARARAALAAETACTAEMHARWRAAQRELGDTRALAHEHGRVIRAQAEQIHRLRATLAHTIRASNAQESARIRNGLDESDPILDPSVDPPLSSSTPDCEAQVIPRRGCDMPTPDGRCGLPTIDETRTKSSFQYCRRHIAFLSSTTHS